MNFKAICQTFLQRITWLSPKECLLGWDPAAVHRVFRDAKELAYSAVQERRAYEKLPGNWGTPSPRMPGPTPLWGFVSLRKCCHF